jgi:hypothetical protein
MLALLATSVAVGYREQRRHDAGRRVRGFATDVGAGSAAVVVFGAVLAVVRPGSSGAVTPLSLVLALLSALVSIPLVVVAAAVAGAAFSRFQAASEWRQCDGASGRPFVVFVGSAFVAGGSTVVESWPMLFGPYSGEYGVPDRLPEYESVEGTLAAFASLEGFAGGLVLVGGGVVLGAYAARRHGFGESVRGVAGLVAVGSLVGVTVVPTAVAVAATGSAWAWVLGQPDGTLALAVASLASVSVVTGVVTTLAVVAGLGVARFETESGRDDPTAAAVTNGGTTAGDEATTPGGEGPSELSSADEPTR